MSITPKTYKEWIAIRDALAQAIQFNATVPPARRVDLITKDVFGRCPPEPAPPDWKLEAGDTSRPPLRITRHGDDRGGILVGFPHVRYTSLTSKEAVAMANALIEHAAYARSQATTEETT
jgi:hypothetical protein